LEQLNTLKNTSIKAELPSIALSLKMLRNLPILSITEQTIAAPTGNKVSVKKEPIETTNKAAKKASADEVDATTKTDEQPAKIEL